MSIKRTWLRILFLGMMAMASFGGAWMNPKEIEDLLHVMNETKVEYMIPDESDQGDKNPPWMEIEPDQPGNPRASGSLRS